MKRVIHVLLAALICVLIVLGAFLCQFVDTLTRTSAELPVTVDNAIAREGTLTRAAAVKEIKSITGKMDHQITSLRADLFARVDNIEVHTFQELELIRKDANHQLTDTRTALVAEISKMSTPAGAVITDAHGLIAPTQNILERTSETADLALDCDHNPDCAFNRYVGTARAIEKTSQSVAKMADTIEKATPATAAAVQSTGSDLAKIVHKFSQPVSWVRGVASTAASIAGKFLGF